jgi:HPr kinase/phosphorylase
MYLVEDLFRQHGQALEMELVAGAGGLKRPIKVPDAHRPGLTLAGYLKSHSGKRVLVFGRVEIQYLRDLSPEVRVERLEAILEMPTPAVIVARRYNPPAELIRLCEARRVPLFRSSMTTMSLLAKLMMLLHEQFAPTANCHGTLVEVFGVGVLLQGESSVGKSEAALGLIERGHRLVSDDVVKVLRREGAYLEGFGAELTRYHMEIRGIGIINVANLYGAVCVRERKQLDIVVKLEAWDDSHFYDRVGLEERYVVILDVKLPYHLLPVKPGRDVVLLVETIALNHRLKEMGYNSAKEFSAKLLETLTAKNRRRRKLVEA